MLYIKNKQSKIKYFLNKLRSKKSFSILRNKN